MLCLSQHQVVKLLTMCVGRPSDKDGRGSDESVLLNKSHA